MWRVGTKVPINVYDGDRPVCQCQTAADARVIVAAVNKQQQHHSMTSHGPLTLDDGTPFVKGMPGHPDNEMGM